MPEQRAAPCSAPDQHPAGFLVAGGGPTPGILLGSAPRPFVLHDGDLIRLAVDGAPEVDAVFDGSAAAMAAGGAGPYALADGMDLLLRVDNGLEQTVLFSAADFAYIANATATEVAAAINAVIAFGRATTPAGVEGMARYVESDNPALAARVRATRVVAARHVFHEAEGLTFDLGGETVRVLFLGGGHSADNLVVHFADRGVLFGGCMVRSHPGLGNTADADLEHWAASAEAAFALALRLVIPGHGEPGGPELLTATAAAVRAR